MSKHIIVLIMTAAFLCMYIPFGAASRILDGAGILLLCVCALITAFGGSTEKK